MRQILLVFSFLIFSEYSFAQEFNPERLKSISAQYEQRIKQIRSNTSIEEKQKYSEIIEINGEKSHLQYIENGIPYYYHVHNQQARETTGVSHIQSEDGMNLSLFGEGITVGVWDGGQVKQSHREFTPGRVVNKEGATFSNHASHVSGTILATGVNSNAKGMAPLSNGIAYTFDADITSIAKEASEGLLISNHSYGFVLGWSYNSEDEKWVWYGGDSDTDLRFGHYSQKSRAIDEIAYNAPYYTSVWSAGNDRSDVGDGTKSPDGPYMIVGPNATAKNNIAVGAITGFSEYKDQTSAVMSNFSSWGPTADGRIKPDIVGDGVGLFSVGSANDSAYTTLSGTSMAAPNVTGSLILAQEYYKSIKDTFMTSSALKALAIHTARKTGNSIGPDAKFGWGVLNTIDILKIIAGQNSSDSLMIEGSLDSNQTQIYEVFSDGVNPITATMVWIDPPGNNGSPGNTDKMLINDLDLRIYDDSGVQYDSWELNQNNFDKAIAAGNHRDNVEKINLLSPENRKYFIEVSHSGTIQNGNQKYSLVITGNKMSLGTADIYNVGTADTLQADLQWATQSGGEAVNIPDLAKHTLVFDNNSIIQNNKVFYLKEDLNLKNIINQNGDNFIVDLLGNTLTVEGEIVSPNSKLLFRNGNLIFEQTDIEEKEFYNLDIEGTDDLIVTFKRGSFDIDNNLSFGSLIIDSAEVNILDQELILNNLTVTNNAVVNITNSFISLSGLAVLDLAQSSFQANKWQIFNSEMVTNNSILELSDTLYINDELRVSSEINTTKIVNGGILTINQALNSEIVELNPNSSVIMNDSAYFNINKSWSVSSEAGGEISIIGSSDISTITLGFRDKLCFDYIGITNIGIASESVVNVGQNSTLLNTINISQENCEDILFANFSIASYCTEKVIKVSNKSSGKDIIEYDWNIVGGYMFNNSNPEEPEIVFNSNADEYRLELNIISESGEEMFIKNISLQENELRPITIISNSSGLVSSLAGDKYVWYRNGELLEEHTSRTIPTPELSGVYYVEYFKSDSSCSSRISEPLELQILSNNEEVLKDVLIYPNPANQIIFIENLNIGDQIYLFDHTGRMILRQGVLSDEKFNLDISSFDAGIYTLKVSRKKFSKYNKIIKND
ncbi:S8 family serine peptidase [Marivirga sp.]|uniref:S8 family serine peptidase n=1 Tax=Marivirga sp. TaxID=2018662 RepID=UPI0025FEFEFB|nr:S8 family serine peptidase [Marivirga sp.]